MPDDEVEFNTFSMNFKKITADQAGLERLCYEAVKQGLNLAARIIESVEVQDQDLEDFKIHLITRINSAEIMLFARPSQSTVEGEQE